jgi:hypothetical protein
VLIVCHGLKSVPLYAAQAAIALGAGASTMRATTPRRSRWPSASAPRRSDRLREAGAALSDRRRRGLAPNGLRYAVRATRPEGTLQSVSFYAGGDTPMPLGRLYTLGIRFFTDAPTRRRCSRTSCRSSRRDACARGGHHARRRLGRGPPAWLEPAIKLVVRRT